MQARAAIATSVALHVVLVGAAIALAGMPPARRPEPVRADTVQTTNPAAPTRNELPEPEEQPPPPEFEVFDEPPELEPTDVVLPEEFVEPVLLPEELLEPMPRPDRVPPEIWLEPVVAHEPEVEPPPDPIEPPAEAPAPEPTAKVVEAIEGQNPPPSYPALALRRQWQGEVLLEVRVCGEGRVLELCVLRSSGYPVLDDAAVAAVRGWRFANGPGTVEVPIEFVLR